VAREEVAATSVRSRTVTWQDPLLTAASVFERSGVESLQAMLDGTYAHPPMMELLGIRIQSVADGDVTFTCTADDSVYNRIGSVHGGLLCTLLDSVIGCAIHSTLPAQVHYTSLELKVNYLRRVHGGMTLQAHGWVVKPGRRVAFAEGDVRDGDGNLLATGSGSCFVLTDA
jgi:uncharacterized protein (TIGR00369 family)